MKRFAVGITLISLNFSAAQVTAAKDYYDLSLEELMNIKITAQKREQEWFEVPLTVDVYNGKTLREQNINHLSDLAQYAPGVVYGRVGNTPNIYVRGIGSDLLSVAADASTAIYADDVYLARPEMALAHFWDVERIEVLKGPQGALYGRNATGGAINIIRSRPSFEKTDAYARVTSGNVSHRQLEAAATTPITNNLAIRGSLLAIKNDGYTDDLDPQGGERLDDTNVAAGRVELRWRATDRLENAITASQYRNNTHGFTLTPADDKGLAEQMGALPVDDFHALRNNIPSYSHYLTQSISWRWDWTSDNVKFQSISAYRNLDADYLLNTDGTEINVTESQLDWSHDQRSQEFRLLSIDDSDWQWLVGATWLNESPRLDVGLIRYPLNTSIVINSQAETTAWGVYGELGWNFYPRWNAKLGVRNTHEHRDDGNIFMSTHDLVGLDSNRDQATTIGATQHNNEYDNVSPQFIVSFTPEQGQINRLWYVSVTEGFKSGGSNSLSLTPSFKPEEIMSMEMGYKYQHENVAWQASIFDYNYKELQVVTFEDGATRITNAASADVTGIDANVLLVLSPQLQWQLRGTALNANYNQFITSLAGAPVDVSGNPMPYAPRWDINQAINFSNSLPIGSIEVSFTHHYQSKTYFNQFADNVISEQAQHIFDVAATWKITDRYEVGASVMNITDEEYYSNLTRFTSTSIASAPEGNALGVTALGRQWRMHLNYKY